MPVLQTLPNDVADRAPARMAPLAKLPVFWSLAGQRVIVAGGSDACAWKAELLAPTHYTRWNLTNLGSVYNSPR